MTETEQIARVRELIATGAARRIREAARLSLAEMAKPCHVTASAVWRWEQGKRMPRGEAALRYAALLDGLTKGRAA